jgi:hypothetical protein
MGFGWKGTGAYQDELVEASHAEIAREHARRKNSRALRPPPPRPTGRAPCGCAEWYDAKRRTKVAGHEAGMRAWGCRVRLQEEE